MTQASFMNDRVWYDLTYRNTNQVPSPVSFFETRPQSYLKTPGDWNVTVARFFINTDSIPIFTFIPGAYSLTLTVGASNYQAFLPYISRNSDATDFGIYTFNQFVLSMNSALLTAFTALKAANPGVISTVAPYFGYDPVSQFLTLYVPTTYPTDGITIWQNFQLAETITHFDIFTATTDPLAVAGKNYMFVVYNDLSGITPPVGYYAMKQAFVSIDDWFTARKLLLTTTTIPVRGTLITGPNNASQLLLTDFEFPVSDIGGASDPFGVTQYSMNGDWRWIDMLGTSDLNTIDITIYWEDKFGTIKPLIIKPDAVCTVKLLFQKKQKNMLAEPSIRSL